MAKVKTNKEIIESLANDFSNETWEKIEPKLIDSVRADGVADIIKSYPSVANDFISTLTNKVVRSLIYSKIFNNPLRELHGGMIEYGDSIEQIFVKMAEQKNFDDHFKGSTTEEGDLIKSVDDLVEVLYIKKNFKYTFKSSVSHSRLRSAFTSETGLSKLINELRSANDSAAFYSEYVDMVKTLKNVLNKKDMNGNAIDTTNIIKQDFKVVPVANFATNPADLSEAIKENAGYMKLPSETYNCTKLLNWANDGDLIFITTPTVKAKLDVKVMADAFNCEYTDVKYKTIEVDSLPTLVNGKTTTINCYGILCDKALVQAYDTIFETDTFKNPNKMLTNIFTNKHGIQSSCLFANVCIFADKNPTT